MMANTELRFDKKSAPIIVVDDESRALQLMKMTLVAQGYGAVTTFSSASLALEHVRKQGAAVAVLDIIMPELSGVELLRRLLEYCPQLCVIMATGVLEIQTVVECIRAGALDYIVKPLDPQRLLTSVQAALQLAATRSENQLMKQHLLSGTLSNPQAFGEIVFESEKILRLCSYIEAVAPSGYPVLITGETGTGKELFARAVHRCSGVTGPFVALNVAGLDDTLLSDTLFGHVKGAFTGALQSRGGLVEQAAGGTLFLDEIGDLSPQSQLKLLRLIQEHEFFAVGSDTPSKSSARIVAATCVPFATLQHGERMRRDLFYRLQSHHLALPPLRERTEDMQALLHHFVCRYAGEQGKPTPAIAPQLVTLLKNWHFPGNIRELQAMVLNACSLHKGTTLGLKVFRDHMGEYQQSSLAAAEVSDSVPPAVIQFPQPMPHLEQIEQQAFAEALQRAEGNQSLAAAMLGMSRQALGYRLKKAHTPSN